MNATTNNKECETQVWDCNAEDNQILEESEILHQRLLELDEDNQILKEYETAYRRSLELAEDNQILEEYETAHRRSLELAEDNQILEEYETAYRRSLEDNQIIEDNLDLAESTRLIEEYETAYRRSLEDNQILEDNHQRALELAESNRLLEEYETIHQQSHEIKLLRDDKLVLFTTNKSELTKQIDALEEKIVENQKQIDALAGEQDTDDIIKHVENPEIIADDESYFVKHFNEIYDTAHNFDEIVYIQEIAYKYRINMQDAIKYSYNCHCCGKNTPVGYELCGRLCDKTFDFSTNYINEYVCFWGEDCKMCKGYENYVEVCVTCSNKKTDSDCGFIVNYNKSYCENCETKDDKTEEKYCYWGEDCENCKEYTGNEEDRFCCSCIVCEKPLTDHEGYSDEDTGNVCCNKCAENHFNENVDEEIKTEEKYCYWGEDCEKCKEYTGIEENRFCYSCIVCEKPLTDHEGYSYQDCDQDKGKICCNTCSENHFNENVDEENDDEKIAKEKIAKEEKESEEYAKFYNNYIQKYIELMLDEDTK